MRPDLNALATFVAIVDTKSFSRAAEICGISNALVTKHVQELERALGVKLVHRTTRQLGLTQAGERFYSRCAKIVAEAEEAARYLEDPSGGSHGLIRVNAAMSIGRLHVLPAVADFLQRNPSVQIDVTLSDRFADLISGGSDVMIRMVEEPRLSNFVARRLAPARWLLVASPAYLRAYGAPKVPGDLSNRNCVVYMDTGRNEWKFRGPDGETQVTVGGNFRANNADGLIEAALKGLGIAAVPSFCASHHVAEGRLVRVLPEYTLPERTLYAVFLPDRHLPERIRSFVQFLADRFGPEPYWDAVLAPTAQKPSRPARKKPAPR